MKSITKFLSILTAFVIFLVSCQKISDKTHAKLIFKATGSPSKSALTDISSATKSSAATLATIALDEFFINIKDIEFEFDDDLYDDDDDDDLYDDDGFEFEGPYLIDVLSPEVSNGIVIDDFLLPNAALEEIEFNIAPCRSRGNDKMFGRSIYVAFTRDGTPYRLWTNKDKEIEIEFDDGQARHLTGDDIRFYVNFKLDKVKANLETMRLGAAVDGNGDGIIEIGHDDPDGNRKLADSLLDVLIGCFDMDDDDDDDDDDD